MTKPVDLDALDALYAKPHDGTPDDSPTAPEVPWVRRYLNLCAIEKATRDAYPAMAAELRERRAREEALAAEIRALREVAEAARAFLPTCDICPSTATQESRDGLHLCDAHTAELLAHGGRAGPLALGPKGDTLRAALAKVPR